MPRIPRFKPRKAGFWSIGQPFKLGIIGRTPVRHPFHRRTKPYDMVETVWVDVRKFRKVK